MDLMEDSAGVYAEKLRNEVRTMLDARCAYVNEALVAELCVYVIQKEMDAVNAAAKLLGARA